MKEQRESDLEIDKIWKKYLSGDDESFDFLYNKFVQVLFVYGLQFTSNRELLKDCIQDVFTKMYDSRKELKHVSNVSMYLRISLKNRVINSLKRENIYAKSVDFLNISAIEENTIDQGILQKEEEVRKREKMEALMNVLTPQQKKVIGYRYVENMSIEDISLRLGINYQSVQNTLQRGIGKIKKYFLEK